MSVPTVWLNNSKYVMISLELSAPILGKLPDIFPSFDF